MTPSARSIKWLREQGYTVGSTERWNQYAKIRQDLFGWIDMIAIKPGEILAVQVTSGSNHAARRTKMQALDSFHLWLQACGLAEIHSWTKPKSQRTWRLRRERLVL